MFDDSTSGNSWVDSDFAPWMVFEKSALEPPTQAQLLEALYERLNAQLATLAYAQNPETLRAELFEVVQTLRLACGVPGILKPVHMSNLIAFAAKFGVVALQVGLSKRLSAALWGYREGVEALPADQKTAYFMLVINCCAFVGDLAGIHEILQELPTLTGGLKTRSDTFPETMPDEGLLTYIYHVLDAFAREGDPHGYAERTMRGWLTYAIQQHHWLHAGQLYSTLAELCLRKSVYEPTQAEKCYEYGQMTYTIGKALMHTALVANGLHYMSVAFQQHAPRRALRALERTAQAHKRLGEVARYQYTQLAMTACHYQLREYAQTVRLCKQALAAFESGTMYHADACQYLSRALGQLGDYARAMHYNQTAQQRYAGLGMKFNQFIMKMCEAEIYFLRGNKLKARHILRQVISELEDFPDKSQREFLLAAANQDITRYYHLD